MSTIQSKWFCVIILFVSINIEVDTADGDTVADVIDGINATIQPILTGIKANGIVISVHTMDCAIVEFLSIHGPGPVKTLNESTDVIPLAVFTSTNTINLVIDQALRKIACPEQSSSSIAEPTYNENTLQRNEL